MVVQYPEGFVQQIVPLLVAVVVLAAVHPTLGVVAHHCGVIKGVVAIAVDLDSQAEVGHGVIEPVLVLLRLLPGLL